MRDPFEARLFNDQAEVEAEALRLHERSPQEAAVFLTTYTQEAMDEVRDMFIALRGTLIVKYTNNRE